MKRLILPLFLLCFYLSARAQSDTLFTNKQEKIACKIIEIGEFEIRYQLIQPKNGPLYIINKSTVTKYTLSNGYTELLLPDELSLENEHKEIIGNRSVIKLSPFSFVNNQISVAYEQVLKVGTNLDVEAGYINNGINNASLYRNLNLNRPNYSGVYIKPGVKFFLGQDFSVKGLRYAHPLKGRYLRLDFAVSYLNFQNLRREYYSAQSVVTAVSTDVNTVAYGGFVNFGRQFILGNILTIEYYFGAGFTGQAVSYTNPAYLRNSNGSTQTYYENFNVGNYHGFMRIPGLGLSGTAGFRIGYILPEKKTSSRYK